MLFKSLVVLMPFYLHTRAILTGDIIFLWSQQVMFYILQIDLPTFLTLTDRDLRELGISTFGARKKMLLAIAGMRAILLGLIYFITSL